MNILKQYQTKYIIIPSFRTKTFIHLQGKYPQTIYMCLCLLPELNYVKSSVTKVKLLCTCI